MIHFYQDTNTQHENVMIDSQTQKLRIQQRIANVVTTMIASRKPHILLLIFSGYLLSLQAAAAAFIANVHKNPPQKDVCRMPCDPRIVALSSSSSLSSSQLFQMKRPILDQIATALFNLENDRVEKSSEMDEKGRFGEPMSWSEDNSLANKLSEVMAGGPGYVFKQFVADIVAGDFNVEQTNVFIDEFLASAAENKQVAMLSFTSCPFCRRAKDYLDDNSIAYVSLELDELPGNRGNEIRAVVGKKVQRTSVPAIWVGNEFVGGCNDGPGLLTLASNGMLSTKLEAAGISMQ